MCSTDLKERFSPWDTKDPELDAHDVSLADTRSVGGKHVSVSAGDIDGNLGLQLTQARKALELAMEQIYLMSMTSCPDCLARHMDPKGVLEATGGVPWFE